MSAKILFDKLNESGIVGSVGTTYFELNGLKTQIKDSSVVGNIIQEWLQCFMRENSVYFRLKQNSQEFPDFMMNQTRDDIDLLEVKCFKKSPNFDIANFQAYCRSLLTVPYRLDSDYLVIEYKEQEDSTILINRLWLKKVWELCTSSERSPIKIQWKQGVPVNIRPAVFYSESTAFKPFTSRRTFVTALKTLIDTNPTMNNIQKNWFNNVSGLYKEQTGNEL